MVDSDEESVIDDETFQNIHLWNIALNFTKNYYDFDTFDANKIVLFCKTIINQTILKRKKFGNIHKEINVNCSFKMQINGFEKSNCNKKNMKHHTLFHR